jgi:protease-4
MIYWLNKGGIPRRTLLQLDLEQGLIEYVPENPLARMIMSKKLVVQEVVEALIQAGDDKRVVALVARIGGKNLTMAQVQEVRDAVMAFRQKGKPAVAYAESFGEFGPGNAAYYLATAFGEIYLQPSGDVGLTGLMMEAPFLKGALEKIGVTPRLDHRKEYKSAMNLFTETKYTEPHRRAVQKVMESQFNQIIQGIAQARGFSAEQVRALIDQGPFLGEQAVQAKLVDGLAYRDEVYARIKERVDPKVKVLSLSKYLERAGTPFAQGDKIALIYGVGGIKRGENKYSPASGSMVMGSDTVAAAFRAASKDKEVKAILFRIDSPGGSYLASDTIWRETLQARQAGKPVIVSMGSVAASGGYFVSMAADKIVAQPGTITGSIGVLAGKALTEGLWNKLGVSWDEVHTSRNATLWSSQQDYSPEQLAKFESWLDRIYADFTSKVAQGRNLPPDKVEEAAKGRIWTGEDAKSLGLVDELGGLVTALNLARQAAGIPLEASVQLKLFPPRKPLWKRLLEKGKGDSRDQVLANVADTLEGLQPVIQRTQQLIMADESAVLTMPGAMAWTE